MLVSILISHHVSEIIQSAQHVAKVWQEDSVENLRSVQIIRKKQQKFNQFVFVDTFIFAIRNVHV